MGGGCSPRQGGGGPAAEKENTVSRDSCSGALMKNASVQQNGFA